jgi:hypothetical protein
MPCDEKVFCSLYRAGEFLRRAWRDVISLNCIIHKVISMQSGSLWFDGSWLKSIFDFFAAMSPSNKKNHCALLILGIFTGFCAQAQIKTVNYDIYENELNGNNPLPAEELFFIKGQAPKDVLMVSIKLLKSGKKHSGYEEYFWKKPYDIDIRQFEVFVSDPLYSNDNYDLECRFFKPAGQEQLTAIKTYIGTSLEAYVRANLQVTGGGIKAAHSNMVMMKQMNKIVVDALEDYRHFLGREFPGFSDITRQKLEQKDKLRLNRAKFNITGRNKSDNVKAEFAAQYVSELIAAVRNESDQYIDNSLLALADLRILQNFPTEKKPMTLPLNFGYGTIPILRSLPEREYLHGPYVGVSMPLANKTFNRVLGNTSFSAGVFLRNFEASDGTQIHGSFIRIPFYAGLGYKVFRLFRINAGAVALEMEDGNGTYDYSYIQPYAGLSLEFRLWVGFNDKR